MSTVNRLNLFYDVRVKETIRAPLSDLVDFLRSIKVRALCNPQVYQCTKIFCLPHMHFLKLAAVLPLCIGYLSSTLVNTGLPVTVFMAWCVPFVAF